MVTAQTINAILAETVGLRLPESDAGGVLSADPQLARDVDRYGINDTDVKARVASAVTRSLVGSGVPTFADERNGMDTDAFYASVDEAAHRRGWTVL
jgi:hypothetical protein